MPPVKSYELGEDMLIKSLSLLRVETFPVPTDLCMDGLYYQIFYEGDRVTAFTSPARIIEINSEEIVVDFFTEDEDLIDTQTHLVVEARFGYLTYDDTNNSTYKSKTRIDIFSDPPVNPCNPPMQFEPTQNTDKEYRYVGDLMFKINPFLVQPDTCTPEYSCQNLSGPPGFNSICEAATFDPITGWLMFQTDDEVEFPPGTYEITIQGCLNNGQTCETTKFDIELISPCFDGNEISIQRTSQ